MQNLALALKLLWFLIAQLSNLSGSLCLRRSQHLIPIYFCWHVYLVYLQVLHPSHLSSTPCRNLLGSVCLAVFPEKSRVAEAPHEHQGLWERLLAADCRNLTFSSWWSGLSQKPTAVSPTLPAPEFLPIISFLVFHAALGRARYNPAALSRKEQFHHLTLLACLF